MMRLRPLAMVAALSAALGIGCEGAVVDNAGVGASGQSRKADASAGEGRRDAGVGGDAARSSPEDAGILDAGAEDGPTLRAAPDAGSPDAALCGPAGAELDGGCGDPQTDPHNCGACGHDCLGGACVAGTCGPLPPGVLATGQYTPSAIAVDAENVYWINAGIPVGGEGCCKRVPTWIGAQILRCAITGCGNRPTVLASLPEGPGAPALRVPSALALDATRVYWTEATAVRACSKAGCGCAAETLASHVEPFGVAVSSTGVVFTERDDGEVATCPLSGCAGSDYLGSSEVGPSGIVDDGVNAYWTTNSSILECALGGCDQAPTALWEGKTGSTQANTTGIAVDATNLYWTNTQPSNAGSVMQCAKASCAGTVVTLGTRRSDPLGIASDGVNVYWAEPTGILACAVGGCFERPTTVAAPGGAAIALDASHVYFTQAGSTGTDGRIVVLAK